MLIGVGLSVAVLVPAFVSGQPSSGRGSRWIDNTPLTSSALNNVVDKVENLIGTRLHVTAATLSPTREAATLQATGGPGILTVVPGGGNENLGLNCMIQDALGAQIARADGVSRMYHPDRYAGRCSPVTTDRTR